MANSSVSATMLQVEPQLKEFCEKATELTSAVAKKASGFNEDQAAKLRKFNLSIAVALEDLRSVKNAMTRAGGRRHKKARKTRRRH